jgi:hypothetical protein
MEKSVDPVDATTASPVPNGNLDKNHSTETPPAQTMPTPDAPSKEPEWASGLRLFTIMAAITFTSFLMLLDGTIVVAAVPRITDDFNSLKDIGWYGAAYQLGRYVSGCFGTQLAQALADETDEFTVLSSSRSVAKYT